MVPESVSFVVIERVSLPDICKLPLLTRVDAVRLLPLISREPPKLIVNVFEIVVDL